jgi:hypothetical protein
VTTLAGVKAHAIAASPALCLLLAAEAIMAPVRGLVSKPEWPQVNRGGQNGHKPMAKDDAEVFIKGALDEPTREWQPVPDRETAHSDSNGNGHKKRPKGGPKLLKAMDAAERWPGVTGPSELSKRTGVSRATARRALDAVRPA